MDPRHAEYVEYYRARLKKYDGNPMYRNSFASEKAIFEAISTARDLDEFKARLEQGNLTVKNAIALVKDQETARMKFYEEINEPIKAKGCKEILAVVDSFTNVMDLVTTVNNLRQKNSVEQSVDGFVDYFYSDFVALENIEVDQKADVPARWKGEKEANVQETIDRGRQLYAESTLPRAREWDPAWNMNYALVWEDRHRRVIPVPDETVKRRIDDHKSYWGVRHGD